MPLLTAVWPLRPMVSSDIVGACPLLCTKSLSLGRHNFDSAAVLEWKVTAMCISSRWTTPGVSGRDSTFVGSPSCVLLKSQAKEYRSLLRSATLACSYRIASPFVPLPFGAFEVRRRWIRLSRKRVHSNSCCCAVNFHPFLLIIKLREI